MQCMWQIEKCMDYQKGQFSNKVSILFLCDITRRKIWLRGDGRSNNMGGGSSTIVGINCPRLIYQKLRGGGPFWHPCNSVTELMTRVRNQKILGKKRKNLSNFNKSCLLEERMIYNAGGTEIQIASELPCTDDFRHMRTFHKFWSNRKKFGNFSWGKVLQKHMLLFLSHCFRHQSWAKIIVRLIIV